MDSLHRMTIEADNGEDILLVCSIESCRRRLVVKRSGGLVVLERGDFFARHVGGNDGLDISVGLGSRA